MERIGPFGPEKMANGTNQALSDEQRLWGEFHLKLSDGVRFILPFELRDALGSAFVITRGPSRTLWLLPYSTWRTISDRLADGFMDPALTAIQRFMSGAAFVEFDRQYRVLIPAHLKDHIGATGSVDAVLAAQGNRVELWTGDRWKVALESVEAPDLMSGGLAAGLARLSSPQVAPSVAGSDPANGVG